MVIVVKPEICENKMKKYIGNNMNLNLNGRKQKNFLIVGNNCCVTIKENLSSVKIIGDNCTVQVLSGQGEIIYIGNNGTIFLTENINEDSINYIGNNGKILTKNGTIQRHNSDSDIRSKHKTKVINLDGKSNVNITGRTNTTTTTKEFMKIPSTISLPNIQIHLTKVSKDRKQ